jgi:putative ABC transport system substrate-binding protein
MRRRTFIEIVGGAAVTWPLTARAQQSARPVVGFLGSETEQTGEHLAAAFRKGLAESGFVDGRNVTIEYRWQGGQYATVQSHLADLLKLRPAVMTSGASSRRRLRRLQRNRCRCCSPPRPIRWRWAS